MEEDQELRFVCKLCNKKYPCGKSLGGHMRSHVIANSAESDEKAEFSLKKSDFGQQNFIKDSKFAEFGNGQTSYTLRENPKKTWRAADLKSPSPLEKICKQCGKGFQSMKALCGHMACHSEKDKGLRDDYSWTSENRKMVVVVDSQSDTEEVEELRLRTRSSKNKKFKKVVVKSSSFSLANNGSSSISEIDGHEQEEVAMCLMLLSRDSGSKGGVNSVVESSDDNNNSVVLETKSSSFEKGENVKLKDDESANSDSGYFLDECAKAESDVSFNGFLRNIAFDEKIKNYRKNEYDEDIMMASSNFESRKRKNAEVFDNSQKRSKYECFNCKKTFKSYQALGGHRPCHKKSNAYYESRYESGENSFLDDSTNYKQKSKAKNSSPEKKTTKSKKNKAHVCPFCDRVFKNGQALGGHKRSHFIVGHGENSNRSPVIKNESPDLLDLNLPAPEADEDDDGNGRFFSW